MKKVTLSWQFFGDNFNPDLLTEELQRHGFRFISASCPVKFAGKIEQQQNDDGSVTFTQTEEEQ